MIARARRLASSCWPSITTTTTIGVGLSSRPRPYSVSSLRAGAGYRGRSTTWSSQSLSMAAPVHTTYIAVVAGGVAILKPMSTKQQGSSERDRQCHELTTRYGFFTQFISLASAACYPHRSPITAPGNFFCARGSTRKMRITSYHTPRMQ